MRDVLPCVTLRLFVLGLDGIESGEGWEGEGCQVTETLWDVVIM